MLNIGCVSYCTCLFPCYLTCQMHHFMRVLHLCVPAEDMYCVIPCALHDVSLSSHTLHLGGLPRPLNIDWWSRFVTHDLQASEVNKGCKPLRITKERFVEDCDWIVAQPTLSPHKSRRRLGVLPSTNKTTSTKSICSQANISAVCGSAWGSGNVMCLVPRPLSARSVSLRCRYFLPQ